ncbi:Serine--tRNA ligase, mitochondrial [Saitozyma podzolica]|uniref:serine--tRNA ligase n=1 Tax=Saitozyma podzolica TaxID=1890683 RepID=A0A427YX44_9TREE|nr:Serine--tRNA ligase, mitochondrial [Saitozyma podzolica]
MRSSLARHASHFPTRGPIIPIGRPPAPPRPPNPDPTASSTASPGSSGGSSPPSTSSSTSAAPSLLPKPRLDYNRLLSDPTATTRNHLLRNSSLPSDHIAHVQRLRDTHKLLLTKIQAIKAKQRDVGQLIRNKIGDTEEALRQAKKLKARVIEYEATMSETETELLDMAIKLPNFSHPAVTPGPEENAVVLETFGLDPIPADPNRDHLRTANHFELVDNEASTIASGSSWPYLKGALALLEMALINYALSIAGDLAWRCGFSPRDEPNGPQQTYAINNNAGEPTHVLAGTAEIPLAALFANRIFLQSALPQKVAGVGHAFRAEAGARGADTRGLYRVHQFTKVELFCVTPEGASEAMMEEMRQVQKEIVSGLGLSVRVLDMPSEELGASAARKYDMEAWMPGRGKWGEASRLESLLLCSALHEACLTIVDLLDIQLYRLPVSPTAYPLPSIRCGRVRVRVRGFHQHHNDAIRHATIRAHSEWHGCGGPAAARGATGERGEAGRAGSS